MSFTQPFSFGSPAPSAFGATPQQPSAFGGSNTFGGTTTGFGATNTFGATAPQASSAFPSTSFGGTSTGTSGFGFGQPTTGSSTFGGTATPSTSGFGFGSSTASPSPFGATQQPAASSVFGATQSPFGAPQASTGSMFGGTTPANPFGATPTPSAFGATPAPTTGTSSFGFGGFGGTTPAPTSAFGATQPTTSAFGSTPSAPFGATTGFAGQQSGTAIAKYVESTVNENNQMVKFLTITAMDQYKNKSNEELRWEDYQRIKQGGGQFGGASTTATSTFGATTPSTTGFGGFGTSITAAPATSFSTFGATTPTPSAFGTTPATSSFGTSSSAFGTTPAAGASPFSFGGTSSTGTTGTSLGGTTPGFGTSSATSASPFSFGGTTGTSSQPSSSTFNFGGTSSAPSQPSAFSFGGSTPSATTQQSGTSPFSFGNTGGTSSTTTPSTFAFGNTGGTSQTASTSPFSFGGTSSTPSTSSSTFSFGGNTGATTGGSLFGGQTSTPTSTFGTGTSNFNFGGQTSTPTTSGSTNSFGFGGTTGTTTPQTGSSMFNFGGSTGTPSTTGSMFNTGTSAFGVTTQQQQQQQLQIQMPSINSTPFGPPPLVIPNPGNVNSTLSTASNQPPMTPVGSVKTARIAVTPHYKMTPRSATKLKPRGFNGKMLTPENEMSASMEARETDQLFAPRQSIKKLDIESSTVDESPLFNREKRAQLISGVSKPEDSVIGRRADDTSRSIDTLATPQRTPRLPDTPFVTSTPANQARNVRASIDLDQSNLNFTVDSSVQATSTPARPAPEGTPVKASDLPKMAKPGYYCSPSLAEMRASTVEALRAVKDFTVGCEGVGTVRFLGETDVRKLPIDDLVIFHSKEIEVYPDESKKPPVGHELNKPAVITLQKCFPKDKSGKRLTAPEDLTRFENKLKHQTQKFGGRFITYKSDAGEWSFRVEHFSRYGLDEDDEDDEENKTKQPQKPLPPAAGNAKQAPPLVNPVIKPQPIRATGPQAAAAADLSDEISVNSSEQSMEHEERLRDARYHDEEVEEEEEYDSQEDMQEDEYEEEEEYDEYENYQPQPARMRYESTSSHSQDLGSDDIESENEYVSPTRRTTGQMVPEQLGLNPAKIQVMKSLLFQDEAPQQGSASKRRKTDREGPSPAVFTPSRIERPRREITPVFQTTKEQESPAAPTGKAPIVLTKQRAERVAIPLEKSVVKTHTDGLKDVGLFMNRSFRVGWGPGGVLFRLGPSKRPAAAEPSNFTRSSVVEQAVGKENPPTFSTLVMERINPIPELNTVEQARQFYLPFLENHLNKSSPEQQPHSEIPQMRIGENFDDFVTSTILTLEQLKTNSLPSGQVGFDASSLNIDHYVQVWKLIKALWGRHSLDVPFELEEEARRHYLSMWLKDAVLPTVKEELTELFKNKSPFVNDESTGITRLRAIFLNLTGKKVKEAVDLAIENKDYRFAMLLAQAANNEEFNNSIRDQLAQWRKTGADKTIEHERMALYKLLAAEVDSVSSSLDWKRALGLQLWYGQPANASIGQIVAAFEHGVVKGHARRPLPIYRPYRDYKAQKIEGSLKFTENFDTNYHVLRLYSDRSHPWHHAMHPLNNSHNIQDYWLSWTLFSALSALNLFNNAAHNGKDYVFELGMSFASQLEMCGLWEWAIYVIYNLPETYPHLRERAIKSILSRNVMDIETLDQEQFLRQRLSLPVEWIEEAKAWRATSRGKINDAVWHLINSRQYETAHHLIVTALASKYILNEAYNEELFNMLDTLERHVNHLIDWENRGGMYYDYLGVEKEFKHCQETLRHTEDSAAIAEVVARLSSLEQFVSSLSKRLAVWVAEDDQSVANSKKNNGGKPSRRRDWLSNVLFDRVSLAEMSTRLSQYGVAVKQLLTDNQPHADLLMTDVNNFNANLAANGLDVAYRLKELAIPEDYRLTQLNDLCANFLNSLQQVA